MNFFCVLYYLYSINTFSNLADISHEHPRRVAFFFYALFPGSP